MTDLPLRPIHSPDFLWLPPAAGWWLVLFVLMIIAIVSWLLIRTYRKRRNSAMYLAREELFNIKRHFAHHQDKALLVKSLSILLRRVSISIGVRDKTATLTGSEWLAFLDQVIGSDEFSHGIGRIIISAPYQSLPDYDSTALLNLVTHWLDAASRQRHLLSP